jgi:ribosomal-protein-alanine N-acetyltransferase
MSVLARLLQREDDHEGLVVERMRRRHLTQILPIEQASYPRPWSRGVFETEIDQMRDGTREYLIARSGRVVVGYAGLWFTMNPDGDEAHITNVAVAHRARRSGVATLLLVELADRAIERGCVSWTLEVRASSTGAQELYRQFGFVPAGLRTRYYENTEDAIVMWCHDIDSPEYRARLDRLHGGSSAPQDFRDDPEFDDGVA